MDACDDPGMLDWPDSGGGRKIDREFSTVPNKKTWALFVASGLAFLTVTLGNPELTGLGFMLAIGLYLAATYTSYLHNKDTEERKKVLDTIDRI
jgi:hypothetical protein